MDYLGISTDVKNLFGDADALVFVDDWKGSDSGSAEAPVYFVGRCLLRSDYGRVAELRDLLVAERAEEWHASAARSMFRGCASTHDIIEAIERCRSNTYASLTTAGDYDEGIRERWRNFQLDPQMRKRWRSESPHSLGLYRYLDFLGWHLLQHLGRGLGIRVIVDRLDWAPPNAEERGLPFVSLCWGYNGLEVQVDSVVDRKVVPEFTRFLGLVDSEAWAFGRINNLAMSDGQTVRQRLLDWQRRGSPSEEEVFSSAEVDTALAREPPYLGEYLAHWLRWHVAGRDIVLRARET